MPIKLPPEALLVQETLRAWREQRGFTLIDAQIELGVSYAQVRALETGEDLPSIPTLRRLATYFGWSAGRVGAFVLHAQGVRPGTKTSNKRVRRLRAA